jgi:hypothetical protein
MLVIMHSRKTAATMRVLMALLVALLMAKDALAQNAGSVIIYRLQASYWNIVRIPADAREAMKPALRPGSVDMVDWSAFKSDPRRYLAPLVIRNEYPASDLPRLVVDVLEVSRGPIAVTWTGGIAVSNNDRNYAQKIYQLFRESPAEYERTKLSGDEARDPLYPERRQVRLLAGRPESPGRALAQIDPLEHACDLAVRKVGTFEGARMTRTQETFVHDGKTYRGCVIRSEGESPCPESATSPWWGLYPFRDTYPAPDDGWTAVGDGWKVVQEKNDRWKTLYYQVVRGSVFCLVNSTWTPDNKNRECEEDVPSSTLRIVASCAQQSP